MWCLTVYTYMSLFIILSSKTDKYRDGTWILIARNSTIIFRFLKLERYFPWSNIAEDSDFKIISHLSATKTGYKVSRDKKKRQIVK